MLSKRQQYELELYRLFTNEYYDKSSVSKKSLHQRMQAICFLVQMYLAPFEMNFDAGSKGPYSEELEEDLAKLDKAAARYKGSYWIICPSVRRSIYECLVVPLLHTRNNDIDKTLQLSSILAYIGAVSHPIADTDKRIKAAEDWMKEELDRDEAVQILNILEDMGFLTIFEKKDI